MATMRWMRPEDFLRRRARGAASPEGAWQHEAFVAAVALQGMRRISGERWLFRPPAGDASDLLAVRSLCHGVYASQALRLPITVVSIPDNAFDPGRGCQDPGPDTAVTCVATWLTARVRALRDRAAGTALFVHLPTIEPPFRPETLAPLIGEALGDLAELWLLGPADGTRYHVVQVHPRHARTLVDLQVPSDTDVVV